jgi:CO/xanthine dehydrogenase Mo-binding subunit
MFVESRRRARRWKKNASADHGFGIALLQIATTSASSSNARVRLRADGKVELMIGATDVGGAAAPAWARWSRKSWEYP